MQGRFNPLLFSKMLDDLGVTDTVVPYAGKVLDNLGVTDMLIPQAGEGEDERVRRMQAEFDQQKAQEAEQLAFEQSPEGIAQQEYEQSLADEGLRNYAPREDLAQDQLKLLMDEQAAARQRALAKLLGMKIGKPGHLSLPPDMEVAPTQPAIDPSIPAIGTPTGGEMLETGIKAVPIAARVAPEVIGEILEENPALPLEIANPVAGALGAKRDVQRLAEENPEGLSLGKTGEMLVTAASGIPIVGGVAKTGKTAGKAGKEIVKRTMKEMAEDAAAKAVRGAGEKTGRAARTFEVEKSIFPQAPETLTFDEFVDSFENLNTDFLRTPQKSKRVEKQRVGQMEDLQKLHKNFVERAYEQGLPVPDNVLEEYPDVVKDRTPTIENFGTRSQEDILSDASAPSLVMRRDDVKLEDSSVVGIANHVEDTHMAHNGGRVLDPANSEEDFETLVQQGVDEVEYQLSQAISGQEWYDESIFRAFQLSAKKFPQLAKSEYDRVLVSAFAGILSPGENAKMNWDYALQVYEEFITTGTITGFKSDGVTLYGHSSLKPLLFFADLIKQRKPEGAARWLLSPHTADELTAMKKDYARRLRADPPDAVKKAIAELSENPGSMSAAEIEVESQKILSKFIYEESTKVTGTKSELLLGASLFGPKVGPFIKNINGLYDITADVWATRTYRRIIGDMFITNRKGTADNLVALRRMSETERTPIQNSIVKKLSDIEESRGSKGGIKLSRTPTASDLTAEEWKELRVISDKKRQGVVVGPATVEAPQGAVERAVMKRWLREVADRTGMKGYQVQAVLWFYEQNLYRQLGGTQASYDFADGAAQYLRRQGIEPD
tara:strand:+ start:287 stop:2791 length:2505 start_codon:yes stop_codon:yes gene_type:complete